MLIKSRKYQFALVSHSIEIINIVRKCIVPDTEELHTAIIGLDDAVSTTEMLIAEGYEVILGHGGTGSHLAMSIGQPIVNIPTTILEIIFALLKAVKLGKRIAVTNYDTPREGLDILSGFFNCDLHQIVFKNHKELELGIRKAIDEGIDVIVGGGVSRSIVSDLNTKVVIIEPGTQVVEEALSRARALAAERRKEVKHHERLKTMLQVMYDGVLFIDDFGRLNFYNQAAEMMLGTDLKPLLGQAIFRYAKEMGLIDVLTSGKGQVEKIIRLNNNDLVINSLPIMIDGKARGAVSLLKDAGTIRNIDRKLRERIYNKGFFAKYKISDIKGESHQIIKLKSKAEKYAGTEVTVFISGETGTGKELLAHSIHNLSPRRKAPFVAINCAALPEMLLESELFGYEEGAFTDAKKGGKIGLFELANHGTIFLDEIGDIPPKMQVRLLRVLENKEVMRIGGDRIVRVDVRIISSTHKNIRQEVRAGNFRADLFFRLTVLRLNIPPLRHRLEDIPLLIEGLLKSYKKNHSSITDTMIKHMRSYNWPGNIRELKALIESYLILLGRRESDEYLFLEQFNEYKESSTASESAQPIKTPIPSISIDDAESPTLKEQLKDYRLQVIHQTLNKTNNNRTLAAKKLGISSSTLWRELKERT